MTDSFYWLFSLQLFIVSLNFLAIIVVFILFVSYLKAPPPPHIRCLIFFTGIVVPFFSTFYLLSCFLYAYNGVGLGVISLTLLRLLFELLLPIPIVFLFDLV